MYSMIVIILLAAGKAEPIQNSMDRTSRPGTSDTMVDRFSDKIFSRALKRVVVDLDATILGKNGHLAVSPCTHVSRATMPLQISSRGLGPARGHSIVSALRCDDNMQPHPAEAPPLGRRHAGLTVLGGFAAAMKPMSALADARPADIVSKPNPAEVAAAEKAKRRDELLPDMTNMKDVTFTEKKYSQEKMGFVKSEETISFRDDVVGEGATFAKGDLIKVTYQLQNPKTGKLLEGAEKDVIEVATGEDIPGFTKVLLGKGDMPPMKVGGKRVAIIPPDLAYGKDGVGCSNIPGVGQKCRLFPDSSVVFSIEVLTPKDTLR